MSVSAALHYGAVLLIIMYTAKMTTTKEVELPPVIEIEIAGPVTPPPKGEQTKVEQDEQFKMQAVAPVPNAKQADSAELKKTAQANPKDHTGEILQPNTEAKAPEVIKKKAQAAVIPPIAKAVEKPVEKPETKASTHATIKATAPKPIQPLEPPPLETVDLAEAPPIVVNDSPDFSNDLDRVDKEAKEIAKAEAAALKAKADQEAQQAQKAHEARLAAIEKNQREENARAATLEKARRVEEAAKAKALAAAEIAERNRKQAAAAAAAVAAAKATQDAEETHNQQAEQQASDGTAAFGTADGAKPLEDFRQRPGNRKPEYGDEDRLHRREGDVIFWVFLNNNGEPKQFKMIRSTGHRSLDLKTLKALKEWRFYAGQEGWVEIPFRWSFIGGAEEMPARLHRSVEQR